MDDYRPDPSSGAWRASNITNLDIWAKVGKNAAYNETHLTKVPDGQLDNRPQGEWNHLEICVLGDSAIYVVNGVVVMAIAGALDKNGNPLKSGQIQTQSEGAECFYRNIRLSPPQGFPAGPGQQP